MNASGEIMLDRRSMLARVGAAAVGAIAATAVTGTGRPAAAATDHGKRTVHIGHPAGVAPGNGYSQVVSGAGRFVAIAGQVAVDETGKLVGPGDPAAQARQVFENLRRCLHAVGADFDDVLSFTIYVADIAIVPAVRAVRDTVIDTANPPASTVVQVVALANPGLLLEIQAQAVTGPFPP
jgi:enamine deaminase RidA (YjgF/YER057c/UK114 family)